MVLIFGGVRMDTKIETNSLWFFDTTASNYSLAVTGPDPSGNTAVPAARQMHVTVYVELVSNGVLRKYMYVYGGYSTALGVFSDFWMYEIPYAAKAFYSTSPSSFY